MEEARLSILENLDKLEEIFLDGQRIPFSGNRLVNEQDAIDILDEIRETLPTQIVKAKEIVLQGDKYIHKSKQLSEELLIKAKTEREKLVNQVGVKQEAERQILEIQRKTRMKCDSLIKKAMDNAASIERDSQAKFGQLEKNYSIAKQRLEAEAINHKRKIEIETIQLTNDLKKRFDNQNAKAVEQLEKYRSEGILLQKEAHRQAERIHNESLRIKQHTQQQCEALVSASRNEAELMQDGANKYAEQTLKELEKRIIQMNKIISAGRSELEKLQYLNKEGNRKFTHSNNNNVKSIPFNRIKNSADKVKESIKGIG